MKLEFHPKLFFYLTLGFVLATVIGTVSHEGGHYIVAKSLGFNPHLGYAYVNYSDSKGIEAVKKYYDDNREAIKNRDSDKRKHFDELTDKYYPKRWESFLITLGGPLQTILTGSIGALLLWFRRKDIIATGISFKQWIFVFLAFFWSREVFNLLGSIPAYVSGRGANLHGDEPKLAKMLGWPSWSVALLFAFMGAVTLLWVIFYIIPKKERLTFILAGPLGAAIGWWFWLIKFGPVLLP